MVRGENGLRNSWIMLKGSAESEGRRQISLNTHSYLMLCRPCDHRRVHINKGEELVVVIRVEKLQSCQQTNNQTHPVKAISFEKIPKC